MFNAENRIRRNVHNISFSNYVKVKINYSFKENKLPALLFSDVPMFFYVEKFAQALHVNTIIKVERLH